MGVTHVIRGADLIAATDVHRLLQALLGLPVPVYRHHALVCGPDGRRLAKRDAAAALGAPRDGGIDGHALAADLLAGRLRAGYSSGMPSLGGMASLLSPGVALCAAPLIFPLDPGLYHFSRLHRP